jgi:APA family basic amino acid/polyamine antiporter
MAGYIATPGVWLGLWFVGGALTLLGALSYAELCAMMPRAGGQYVFLREAFGPRVAFLYGWTLALVIQTGFNAAVAIAFAKFLGGVGLRVGETDVVLALGRFTLSRAQIVAVGVIAVLTWVNARGVREGALVQNVFTVLKVGAIALLVIVGFGSGKGSFSHFAPVIGTELGQKGLEMGFLAAVGVAMSKALFAYDAWNTVTFAAEEVRDPERSLPRALLAGTIVTTLAYTAACAVYLYVIPLSRMAGITENRVAADVAGALMGNAGVMLVSIAILVSTFGCVNGLILGGARVLYAMARDGLFFRTMGTIHSRYRTPAVALVVQAAWASVLCLSGTYGELLDYVMLASLLFYVLTVIGLFALRVRRPDAPRPVRAPGYPILPAIYVALTTTVAIALLIQRPQHTWLGLGVVAMGAPVYGAWRAIVRRRPAEP